MAVHLTEDAIAIVSNEQVKADIKPLVQVLDVKKVNAQTTTERYRVVVSDGKHFMQAMLATQINHFVTDGKMQKGSIIQLLEYICNTIQNKKIIIMIELAIIVEKSGIIGEPKPFPASSANAAAPPQALGSLPAQVPNGHPRPMVGNELSSGSFNGQTGPGHGSIGGGALHQPKPEPGAGNAQSYSNSYGNPRQGPAHAGAGVQPNSGATPRTYGSVLGHNTMPNNQNSNPYGRAIAPSMYPPAPNYVNRGPIAKNEAPARIIPVAALNPYQGRWTIKARVTSKGELRKYNNPRGEGKVFSFDLLDSDGGEIRATCFNLVADQFYDRIEAGKVYLISKGTLKPAPKNFNHLNNDYEIHLETTSTIEPCPDGDESIPKQQFNFRPIGEIETMDNNSMVDVIGVVVSINPSAMITRKNGTETQKRTLQIADISGRSVEFTLWGNFCNAEGQQMQDLCDKGLPPVLAVKSGRVSDFSGKSIGTITTSQLFINPEFPEAHRLREWYAREGKNVAVASISKEFSSVGRSDNRKTVTQIKDEGLGRSEKPDWITVRATVSFIKMDNFCYPACPLMVGDKPCNKKVVNNGDGAFRCDRCDQSVPEPEYRYLIQFQLQDHTGLTWATAFQEAGEEIMGVHAKELYFLKHEEQDDTKVGEILQRVIFNQYLFKLKVKEETFNDEQRVKSTVVKAERLNFASECKYLIGAIKTLSKEETSTAAAVEQPFVQDQGMSSNSGYRNVRPAYGGTSSINSFQTNPDGYKAAPTNPYSSNTANTTSYTSMQTVCNKCGGSGHSAMSCPRLSAAQTQGSFNRGFPSGGGGNTGGGSDVCYKCNQSGHWARDCPQQNAIPAAYGNTGSAGRFGGRSGGY